MPKARMTILRTLRKAGIKASFFLTGDFCRRYPKTVKKLKKAGHYVGPHSDKHLLYCDWQNRDSLCWSPRRFYRRFACAISTRWSSGYPFKGEARLFIPPYEWYNDSIVAWSRQAGLTLLNYTPGALSHADYTAPEMKNYRSSEAIYNSILDFERNSPNGLNGFYLLMHVGAGAWKEG
jgi:endoglucanase